MKAILKSIRPIHTANILNGDKTIEISTTAPKEWKNYLSGKTKEKPAPREVYIYCTKGDKKDWHLIEVVDPDTGWEGYEYDYYIGSKGYLKHCLEGKVVAKFTLNKVEEINGCQVPFTHEQWFMEYWTETFSDMEDLLKASCLDYDTFDHYLEYAKHGYAWHIDNLVIFDRPKELSEFKVRRNDCPFPCDICDVGYCKLKRPPQSWQFIEI